MTRFDRKLLKETILVGLAATIVAFWLDLFGVGPISLNRVRLALSDIRARDFQYFHTPPTKELVHLDLDDATTGLVGWPMPREKLAQMIDEINRAGAKVLDMDMIFPDPQVTLIPNQPPVDHDKPLAEAIQRFAGNGRGVLIPLSININEAPDNNPVRKAMVMELTTNPELEDLDLKNRLLARGFKDADLKDLSKDFRKALEDAVFDRVQHELQRGAPADLEKLRATLLPRSTATGIRGDAWDALVKVLPDVESLQALLRFTRVCPPGLPPLLSQDREQEIPIPSLSRAAAFSGFVDMRNFNDDPTVRSIPLWIIDRNRLVPQMGLSLACAWLGVDPKDLKLSSSSVTIPLHDGTSIVIPVHDAMTDQGNIGMLMDIPWFGSDDWATMYDWPDHKTVVQHYPLTQVWDICRAEAEIEDNNIKALGAVTSRIVAAPDDVERINQSHPAYSDTKGWNELIDDTLNNLPPGTIDEYQPYLDNPALIDSLKNPNDRDMATAIYAMKQCEQNNTKLSTEQTGERNNLNREVYGKAVLIGSIATAAFDYRPTPLHAECPGVVVHGAIFNAILSRYFIHPSAPWVPAFLILFVGLLITFEASYFDIFTASIIGALIVAGFVIFDFLIAYDLRRTEIDAAGPLAAAVFSFVGCTLWRYFREKGEKSRITRRFSSYVDPNLVNYMLDHPEQATFKGEQRELTVVFTDLAGFTTVSETLKQDTVPLLNEYLGLMEPVIRRHRGLLNKFLGDGIMFFFGAPEPYPGDANLHAMAAVETVVEMQRVMIPFNESLAQRSLPALKMRAGVSTGDMVVGDAGTESRSDYTVLGDRVNFAARLESANKATGTLILVSDRTVELLRGRYLVRPIGRLQVVGKIEPVMTYEPLALVENATDEMRKLVKLTKDVTDSYAAAQFAECVGATHELLTAFGDKSVGPLCQLYRRLCLEYLRKPPEEFFGQIKLEAK